MTDKKIEIKINRYIKHIDKDDLILDNGSCIQVVTQSGARSEYGYGTLIMSKKLFKELMNCGFIYPDVSLTKKANEKYGKPVLCYLRFDIDKMIESGGYTVVKNER